MVQRRCGAWWLCGSIFAIGFGILFLGDAARHQHSFEELQNLLENTIETEASLGETSTGQAVIARTRRQIAKLFLAGLNCAVYYTKIRKHCKISYFRLDRNLNIQAADRNLCNDQPYRNPNRNET